MNISRVFDILVRLKEVSNKSDILNSKENKKWKNYSVDDFYENAQLVGSGLLALGLERSEAVCIMANNRPEWNFVDYGAQQVAMPLAPIYPTVSASDLKYILNHSEAKVIFISDKSIYQKLVALETELPFLKYVFSFNHIEGVKHFSEFLDLGRKYNSPIRIEEIKRSITENDLYTIIYTSGTTGEPKGVMVSHKGILSNVMAIKDKVPFSTEWRALSFLPLNHVYERVLNTLYLYQQVSIYYAENFETIGDNCREIQPQVFVAVPRILERVLEKICAAGDKLTGIKKLIFSDSIRLAEKYELKGNGVWYEMKRKFYDMLVYSKWRKAIGGKIVCVVSGGAALNPRIEKIFFCAGIPLLQGYGLTETSVVISVNYFGDDNIRFGTVGPVVEDVQVKIAEEDGEILMKGPSLMLGYYKNEAATSESIDSEGWFHTGDVGVFVDERFLKITDRKKEIFKNSAGKYISPIAIENKIKESKFVEQCIVIGEGQKFVSALIIPNMVNYREHCNQKNIEWKGNAEMHNCEELKQLISSQIKAINQTLAPHEQLKRVQIVNDLWTVEGGEITPKLSLKRKVIISKHKTTIDKIFLSDN